MHAETCWLKPGHRLGDPLPRRVLVLRALQLGDMLCAVPALRALRRALPEAEISLLGLPWAAEFAERFSAYIDRFLCFPGYPGLPEQTPQVGDIPGFLRAIQAENFDLALQLHGSGLIVNPLLALLGAGRMAGYYADGAYCPDRHRFLPYADEGLEIRRLLKLLDFLGVEPAGEHLDFPLSEADFRKLQSLPGMHDVKSYVCIHPGASVPERRWPAERFGAVAADLARQGFQVVLSGTASEQALTRQVARTAYTPCLDLAGQTDLGMLAALVKGARLLVCNDTGVSHVAAAVGTPSVVLSTGTNPSRWRPIDVERHHVLNRTPEVSAAEVLAHAALLLRPAAVSAVESARSLTTRKSDRSCNRCAS